MSRPSCCLLVLGRCYGRQRCCSFLEFSKVYCRALVYFFMEKITKKCKDLCMSRSCLGCCAKPQLVTAVDEPTKGLRIQGRKVQKLGVSEDFWSTSTCDMENSAVQSQRSVSSISTSNLNFDHHGNAGSTSNPSEIVNHGLLLWNRTRQQWVGNKSSQNHMQIQKRGLSLNATYESLLGTSKPFPRPVPLSEMVEFLVDVWEQEGMYD